jgi:hypothetical protein
MSQSSSSAILLPEIKPYEWTVRFATIAAAAELIKAEELAIRDGECPLDLRFIPGNNA